MTPRSLMRAIVYDDYGDAGVFRRTHISVPSRKRNEIRIAVYASSINAIDYQLRRGDLKRLVPGRFPRVPGFDVAGIVVESDEASEFKNGDRVMALLDSICGGACADYVVCSESVVAGIPESMSFEQAAALPLAGTTALQSLRDHGEIQKGQRVLINGASGGVGSLAIQIAKAYDCHVDAVASGENETFCKSLGADHFFDCKTTDFTKSEKQWDLVLEASGKPGFSDLKPIVHDGGRYVSIEPDVTGILMTVLTYTLSKSARVMLAKPSGDDLRELIQLFEAGKLVVAIDSTFDMFDIALAHRRMERADPRGKIVLVNKPE